MIRISHRGNLIGSNPNKENHPDYIIKALTAGFNVEIDVWRENSKWILGHDGPQYEVSQDFFYNNFLWCHAKNIIALKELSSMGVHCFWHQTDDVVITTRGYLWTFPGKELTTKSICVLPETVDYEPEQLSLAAGICSDYIGRN